MNWATQIAARVAKTASSVLCRPVPPVVQPPHAKPMIMVITAPQIKPQIPNLTFPPVSGFIDMPPCTWPFFARSSSSSPFFRIRSSGVLKRNPPQALLCPTQLIRAGLLKPSASIQLLDVDIERRSLTVNAALSLNPTQRRRDVPRHRRQAGWLPNPPGACHPIQPE